MKIGIFTDNYLPNMGGCEIYVYNLALFARSVGYSAEIFTFAQTDGESERGSLLVVRFLWSRKLRNLWHFWLCLLKFSKQQDILHAIDSYKMGFYTALASIVLHKPLLVTLEGKGILDLPDEKWYYRLAHDFYRWFTLKRAKAIIASCREFETIAKRIVPNKKIFYIPNPVDDENFKPQFIKQFNNEDADRQKIILTVRRLVPKNGIQYLILALPEILKRIPDVKYMVIGTGRLEHYLKDLVKNLGLVHNVFFLGSIPNEKIETYIADADVMVFPSSAEATSLACTEAMSSGKAVVASAIGGYPELIENNISGLLVNLFDRKDSDYNAPLNLHSDKILLLANAICRVLEDEVLKNTLGEGARKRVEQEFAWRVLGVRIIEIYKTLSVK